MAAVPLFRDTNIAAVTSRENTRKKMWLSVCLQSTLTQNSGKNPNGTAIPLESVETFRRIPTFPIPPKRARIAVPFVNYMMKNPVYHGQFLRISTSPGDLQRLQGWSLILVLFFPVAAVASKDIGQMTTWNFKI